MSGRRMYWVNKWIHGCISNGHLVFLDERGDCYFLVEDKEIPFVLPVINSNIRHNNCEIKFEESDICKSKIDELLRLKIITQNEKEGKILEEYKNCTPDSPFEALSTGVNPEIYFHHILCAFISGIIAQLILSIVPFNVISRWHKRYKKVNVGDDEKALELARIYDFLRPIVLKSRICLFDSLSMSLFCRFYGVYPKIVFGVAGEPFKAHCWLQYGRIILNDSPQSIRDFTPITAI